MPSGSSTSGVHGPSATTTSPASSGPAARIDAPMRLGAMQRARVAGKRNAAERGESAPHRRASAPADCSRSPRRSNARRGGTPAQATARARAPHRHRAARWRCRSCAASSSSRACAGKRAVAAVKLEPAVAAQISFGAGFARSAPHARPPRAQTAAASSARSRSDAPAATRRGMPPAKARPSAGTSDDNWLPARA